MIYVINSVTTYMMSMPKSKIKSKKQKQDGPKKRKFGALPSPRDDRDYLIETILGRKRARATTPSKLDLFSTS